MITEQNCTMLCDFYQLTMGNGYYNTRHATASPISTYFSAKFPTAAATPSAPGWSR